MKPEISYDDFSKLDLRVATVVSAREHPNADKLLLLEIDVGDRQKQIIAGIRGHYRPEELVGRQIIVVDNLEEVVLRGEESQGMLLAATDGEQIVLLRPDRECEPGAAIK
jgi:methionine--tRNA ligase beta chain